VSATLDHHAAADLVPVANGEIIATSETYETKASAKNGIAPMQTSASGATVVDLTE
jgi:uncharacterized protein YegP (UPF0339 family)